MDIISNNQLANMRKPEIPETECWLEFAPPRYREKCRQNLQNLHKPDGWTTIQRSFYEVTDDYLKKELTKPADANIGLHEAGGQWRIAFPHLDVCGDTLGISDRLAETMSARIIWTGENFFHGFPDCAEVHHQIETFVYFQLALFYSKGPGWEMALESIEDVAHHMGNWESGVPDWYNWDTHRFVSMYLGTREVRNFAPYDYQEANHFRFIDVLIAAYVGSGKQRYMELLCDYADTWCEHIERSAEAGLPIRCQILPGEVETREMGGSGQKKVTEDKTYVVFYGTVSSNTAYDVVGGLQDIYRLTGNQRYLLDSRLMLDQFFGHGNGGKPAAGYRSGAWVGQSAAEDTIYWSYFGNAQVYSYLSHMALRHDMITGENYYKEHILNWAKQINEFLVPYHQMAPDLLVAAHYYDGDPSWLARAYAMGIRVAATLENNDSYGQCGGGGRQSSRMLIQHLYQPAAGGCEWSIRGNMPIWRIKHISPAADTGANERGLSRDVAFRTWRNDSTSDNFEAVNMSDKPIEWQIEGTSKELLLSKKVSIRLEPKSTQTGTLEWTREGATGWRPE
jgi:hypothetical protein